MSDDIKWNKEKKELRDAERDRERLKDKVGLVYKHWKARLTARVKRPTSDLIKMAEELRDQVKKAVEETGLQNDPFGIETMKLIQAKVENLHDLDDLNMAVGSSTDQINILTRFLPDRPDGQPQTPETYEFRTEEELFGVAFVKKWIVEDGFVGLVRKGNAIYALFESSEMRLIGAVATRIGVERLPTVEEFQKNVQDNLKRN